jgi:hypothetical protein
MALIDGQLPEFTAEVRGWLKVRAETDRISPLGFRQLPFKKKVRQGCNRPGVGVKSRLFVYPLDEQFGLLCAPRLQCLNG